MARSHRRLTRSGTLSTVIADSDGSRSIELNYSLSIDLDSIVRQLAPLALLQPQQSPTTTRLNGAVVLSVMEVEAVEV